MLSLLLFVVDGEGLIAGGSWPATALLGVRVGFGLPAAGPGAIVVGGGFGLAFLLGPPPLGSVTGVGRLLVLLLLLVVAALGWLTPPGGCAGGGCGRLLL